MEEQLTSLVGQGQNILKKMAVQLNKFIGRYKKTPAIEGQIKRGNEFLQQKKWIEAELIFKKSRKSIQKNLGVISVWLGWLTVEKNGK